MTQDAINDAVLREALAALRDRAGDGRDCPSAERLWDSASGSLGPRETGAIGVHLAACGECAAAWRLAREILVLEGGLKEPAADAASGLARAGRGRWYGLAAAAAAAVVLLAGLWSLQGPGEGSPTMPVERAREAPRLASEIPAEAGLPREDFVLRWSGAPDGSTYDLRVTTEDLEPLARAFGIEMPEYRIDPGVLEKTSPGSVILWRVTAHFPEGGRIVSPTFRNVVK